MLSRFGQVARTLRLRHGNMLLSDMAERLGCSPSYLSAVEFGRRPVPADWPTQMTAILRLAPDEEQALRSAATASSSKSRGAITLALEGLTQLQEEVALQFASRIHELTPEELEAINQKLLESRTGEQRWRNDPR